MMPISHPVILDELLHDMQLEAAKTASRNSRQRQPHFLSADSNLCIFCGCQKLGFCHCDRVFLQPRIPSLGSTNSE